MDKNIFLFYIFNFVFVLLRWTFIEESESGIGFRLEFIAFKIYLIWRGRVNLLKT